MLINRFLLTLAVGVSTMSALGYDSRFGPFPTNQVPQPFRIVESTPQGRPRIQVVTTADHQVDVCLLDDQDKPLAGPWRIAEDGGGGADTITVYRADLNHDGKVDFIVQVWLGGCGLASGYHKLAFILSGKSGYKVTGLTTLFPSPEDFIDLRKDGGCQFIQTSFVHGFAIPDGPVHNYWVYNLYAITGDELHLANQLLPDFPRWIWYSFKENHRPATELSPDLRHRLWKADRADQEVTIIKPLLKPALP